MYVYIHLCQEKDNYRRGFVIFFSPLSAQEDNQPHSKVLSDPGNEVDGR